MTGSKPGTIATALLAGALVAGCGGRANAPATLTPAAMSRADGGRSRYTSADVRFMSGMIGHHAQAVLMAGWAPGHGASPAVRALCERIVVGQRDEIGLMQRWLRERNESVPAGDAAHDMMGGMDHSALMPGMLTAEQLIELDRARGPEFDRLFLTYMIKHHEGAVTMVDALLGAQGAAQDEIVFKLSSDIYADQTTEIERMSLMLTALPPSGKNP